MSIEGELGGQSVSTWPSKKNKDSQYRYVRKIWKTSTVLGKNIAATLFYVINLNSLFHSFSLLRLACLGTAHGRDATMRLERPELHA